MTTFPDTASPQLSLVSIDIHSIEMCEREGYPWAEWDLLGETAPCYWCERDGIATFHDYRCRLIEEKRRNPGDDLTTLLVEEPAAEPRWLIDLHVGAYKEALVRYR